jgi:hypothetical protein
MLFALKFYRTVQVLRVRVKKCGTRTGPVLQAGTCVWMDFIQLGQVRFEVLTATKMTFPRCYTAYFGWYRSAFQSINHLFSWALYAEATLTLFLVIGEAFYWAYCLHLQGNGITNTGLEYSPSWEADNRVASSEFSCILWDVNFLHLIQNSTSPVPVYRQTNPVFLHCFPEIQFNIFLSHGPGNKSPNVLLVFQVSTSVQVFLTKFCEHLFILPPVPPLYLNPTLL